MNAQPETRETVADFIARNGITLTAERIASRSDISQDQWSKDAFHYLVTLRRDGLVLPTFYSMGSGHVRWASLEEGRSNRLHLGVQGFRSAVERFWKPGERIQSPLRRDPDFETVKSKLSVPIEPDAASVLDSLRLDAQSVEFSTFEDWCAECGYDTDSRKAEAVYRACQDGRAKLAGFLGRDLYAQLLECEPL